MHFTHPSRKKRAAKSAEVNDGSEPRGIGTEAKLVVVDVPRFAADVEIYRECTGSR